MGENKRQEIIIIQRNLEWMQERLKDFGLSEFVTLEFHERDEDILCKFTDTNPEEISFGTYQDRYDDRAGKIKAMFADVLSRYEYKHIKPKVESSGFDEYRIYWDSED